MQPRAALSAADIEPLYAEIDRRLTGLGIETQPAVASRILRLTADRHAGLRQYADVVKTDVALSGRLLRLANSAFFAQLKPVTTLERACVLLGLERLKAVSLGFYLSRAAVDDPRSVRARRVWGESVFRACLAAEVARTACPALTAEAFTVGLMLDAGAPLLCRLLGADAERILDGGEPPSRQFRAEFESLPFTHVDVVASLARRWAMPEVLARPLEWHHAPPPPGDEARREPTHLLHRVAHYVGAIVVHADACADVERPMLGLGESTLAVRHDALRPIVRRAADEYAALRDVFKDVADPVADAASVFEQAHTQLIASLDQTLATDLQLQTVAAHRLTLSGHVVEIEPGPGGRAIAYLRDRQGERLISHAFEVRATDPAALVEALGLDAPAPFELAALDEHLRSLAA